MQDDLGIVVDLEYDLIKNQELGAVLSKEKVSEPLNPDEISNLQAGSEKGGSSYLSVIPTTIQIVKPEHTLFVWRAAFHPGINRRFTSVVITCKLSDAQPTTLPAAAQQPPTQSKISPLKIIGHAPRKSFGGSTSETKKTAWGLEFPLLFTGGGIVEVGVAPTTHRESKKEVEHAFTIIGTPRGTPNKHTCVWTIEENKSTERGIPSELQIAALVRHTGLVQWDVTVTGRASGGVLPPYYLKAKTSAEERRKLIDPSAFVGLLHEYELKGDLSACDRLLQGWTGEVEGSLLEFKQSVIKS